MKQRGTAYIVVVKTPVGK